MKEDAEINLPAGRQVQHDIGIMCLSIPGLVKKIEGNKAVVAYSKEEREVLVGEKGLKVGDWVSVQMGVIMSVMSKEEAKRQLKAWSEIK